VDYASSSDIVKQVQETRLFEGVACFIPGVQGNADTSSSSRGGRKGMYSADWGREVVSFGKYRQRDEEKRNGRDEMAGRDLGRDEQTMATMAIPYGPGDTRTARKQGQRVHNTAPLQYHTVGTNHAHPCRSNIYRNIQALATALL